MVTVNRADGMPLLLDAAAFQKGGENQSIRRVFMKERTAQRFLKASGICALLGGGSCLISFNPLPQGEEALGWLFIFGFSGIGMLVIAAILGAIGLILEDMTGRNNYVQVLDLKEKARRLSDSDTGDGESPKMKQQDLE